MKSFKSSPTFPGILIVGVVALLIGGRMMWIHANRPAHRQEISAAFGSISLFSGDIQMNPDASKVTYVGTSPIGYGLFFFDSATGKKKIVCEENGQGFLGAGCDIRAWPWSPDGNTYVYGIHDKLIIQPLDNAKAPTEFTIGSNAVRELVWLNPDRFAYVFRGTHLWQVQKQADGQWNRQEILNANGISSLAAVDDNTIAWLQDGLICRLDLTVGLANTTNKQSVASVSNSNFAPPTNGLILWLDASTLKQEDQTPVSNLADLSSSKNDAFPNGMPPVFNGPKSQRALNGKGTIHFTSVNNTGLSTRADLGITGNAPRTVFVVMHHDAGKIMRVSIGDFASRFGFFGLEEEDRFLFMPRIWNRWANRLVVRSPDWNISGVIYDGKNQSAYVNGVLLGTNSVAVNTVNKKVEIGLRTDGINGTNAAGSDGDFAELLIYDGVLDEGDRKQVEKYLKLKWLANKLLSTESPLVWCDPQMPEITKFIYSRESGQLLLAKREGVKDSLWRFDPQSSQTTKIAEAGEIRSPQPVGKNGYAYASLNAGKFELMLTDASGAQKPPLFENAFLRDFHVTPDGGKMLVAGIYSNEPAMGIWQYDTASQQFRLMVSSSAQPSAHAQKIFPLDGTIKLASGRDANCIIFPPPNADPKKKYPVLIGYGSIALGDNGLVGPQWMPALANCGAYLVIVTRRTWAGGIEYWEENVKAAYNSVAQNTHIDTSRVFVFSVSAETQYTDALLTNSPNLWKGIILLNPITLPDFSNAPRFSRVPKILINIGGEEHRDAWIEKYQLDALKSGVIVENVVHPGEKHYIVGVSALTERTEAITRFITEE